MIEQPIRIREKQAEHRQQQTRQLGLSRVLSSEEPDFAADLRDIWPSIPDHWTYVESYYAPAFMGDVDVQMFQMWLCGNNGELLIQVTQAVDETPLMHVSFVPASDLKVRLYADGKATLEKDQDRVCAAIHKLHLRHNIPAPGVH